MQFGADDVAGIRRSGHRRPTYRNERTGRAPSKADLARIRALAIPPAWTDVWISAAADTHLQATGRDAAGRKQYRYHDDFTAQQASAKFEQLNTFAQALGSLRRRVTRDLRRPGLSHDRVVATVVRLLDVTSLRVGNDEYARDHQSFGLTTLRDRHVVVRGSTVNFRFRGKSAHQFDVAVEDRRLARIVRACQDLPGQRLFVYDADDGPRVIGSQDVNDYLGEHALAGATAKTFRTWNATVIAAAGFADAASKGISPTKAAVNTVIDTVAAELGNTRAVCRRSYIHPVVIESFIDESLQARWQRPIGSRPSGLTIDERRTSRLLRNAKR